MATQIKVKVTPNAKINQVCEDLTDFDGNRSMKVKTSKPPEDGKANEAVIEIIAEYLDVKRKNVKIINGQNSRNKVVEIV